MKSQLITATLLAVLPILGNSAQAGETINVAGTMACVNDKWDETERAKGHKQVSYTGRCVVIPDDKAAQKYVEECAGNYEFLPDGSWKSQGTCTVGFKDGKVFLDWEEGSQLKDYVYKFTGGSGKYEGAKGGGTYKTEELTTTLYGGRKAGTLELR